MVDVAKVSMFGLPVGTFRWDDQYDVVRFEYDSSFVGRGLEPSPLMMPVREGRVYSFADLDRETFKGLPGMLADSLPDTYGRALFDRWLALTGRTSSNPIETLCFLGKRCMGALEFEPAMDMPYDPHARFEIDSLRHGPLRLPNPSCIFLRTGLWRDAGIETAIFRCNGDVPSDGV